MASTQKINTELLKAAREAKDVLYYLSLAEKADKRIGWYTRTYDKLNKAVEDAEKQIEDKKAGRDTT